MIASVINTKCIVHHVHIQVNNLDELYGNLYEVIPIIIQFMRIYRNTTPPINIAIKTDCGLKNKGMSSLKNLMIYANDNDKKILNKAIQEILEQIKNASLL